MDRRLVRPASASEGLEDVAIRLRDHWRHDDTLALGWVIAKGAPGPAKKPESAAELDARFDERRLLHASAMGSCASHALSVAQFTNSLPDLRATVVDLLRLVDAGTLTGVWPLMHTIRQVSAPIFAERATESDPYDLWQRTGSDTSVSWWRIHVTDLLFGAGQDTWEAALQQGVISAEDVQYKLAGWPRMRGSTTGARRREIIKRARELTVATQLDATYDATDLLS